MNWFLSYILRLGQGIEIPSVKPAFAVTAPFLSLPALVARLTDSLPVGEPVPASPVHRLICALCDVLLRAGVLPASHGICGPCKAHIERGRA
jgi:hypothetical protein